MRSNGCECLGNEVDWPQHSRIGNGPQCRAPRSMFGRCPKPHLSKRQPLRLG